MPIFVSAYSALKISANLQFLSRVIITLQNVLFRYMLSGEQATKTPLEGIDGSTMPTFA